MKWGRKQFQIENNFRMNLSWVKILRFPFGERKQWNDYKENEPTWV